MGTAAMARAYAPWAGWASIASTQIVQISARIMEHVTASLLLVFAIPNTLALIAQLCHAN